MRALALGLKRLAHPHERDVEAALQHAQRPRQHIRTEPQLLAGLAYDLFGGVAPAQAALGDLVQRRGTLGGRWPKMLQDS